MGEVMKLAAIVLAFAFLATAARAEDGYDLWLRYTAVGKPLGGTYRAAATAVVTSGTSPTIKIARDELVRGLGGLLRRRIPVADTIRSNGAIVFGTPAYSHTIAALKLPLDRAGPEGYVIRSVTVKGHKITVIAGNTDMGVLYGAFRFLRQIQTHQPIDRLDIVSAPLVKLRMLNHWDNIDGTIERGYAGFSILNW